MGAFIGHDVGTGGTKTVLCSAEGEVLAESSSEYGLDRPQPGFAEQDPAHWWHAVCENTRAVLDGAGVAGNAVEGVCFAGQMLTLVPMDRAGEALRPALSWMDGRAEAQAARMTARMGGRWVVQQIAGAHPTGKDIVAKVAWLADHEPALHRAVHAYGDATSYLVTRATGVHALDATAAGATGLFDARKRRWIRPLAFASGFPLAKTAPVRASTDIVAGLAARPADDMGLPAGVPIAAGLADVPAAALGSGAIGPGRAHVYLGTSAWVAVSTESPLRVADHGIASVPHADPDACLAIGESETAGACRQWFIEQVRPGAGAMDDDEAFEGLVASSPAGANGLRFMPWLYGERAPVPDPSLRGGYVGLSLNHTRADMARALCEGVALNVRWILGGMQRHGQACPSLRAIGGGTRSDAWLQILADVTERPLERVAHPRAAGALGAAMVAAVATHRLPSVHSIGARIRVDKRFEPNGAHSQVYRRALDEMQRLQPAFSRLGQSRR